MWNIVSKDVDSNNPRINIKLQQHGALAKLHLTQSKLLR